MLGEGFPEQVTLMLTPKREKVNHAKSMCVCEKGRAASVGRKCMQKDKSAQSMTGPSRCLLGTEADQCGQRTASQQRVA